MTHEINSLGLPSYHSHTFLNYEGLWFREGDSDIPPSPFPIYVRIPSYQHRNKKEQAGMLKYI